MSVLRHSSRKIFSLASRMSYISPPNLSVSVWYSLLRSVSALIVGPFAGGGGGCSGGSIGLDRVGPDVVPCDVVVGLGVVVVGCILAAVLLILASIFARTAGFW